MNIYQMYHKNNCQFNFYVIRDSWSTVIAKIIGIDGVNEGDSINGKPPYYGNPKVYAELYKVDDNESDIAERLCHSGCFIEETELSCPGTYAYEMVD